MCHSQPDTRSWAGGSENGDQSCGARVGAGSIQYGRREAPDRGMPCPYGGRSGWYRVLDVHCWVLLSREIVASCCMRMFNQMAPPMLSWVVVSNQPLLASLVRVAISLSNVSVSG
jgi:hypothetical protein